MIVFESVRAPEQCRECKRLDHCLLHLLSILPYCQFLQALTPNKIHLVIGRSGGSKQECIFSGNWPEMTPMVLATATYLALTKPGMVRHPAVADKALAEKALAMRGIADSEPEKVAVVVAAGADPRNRQFYKYRTEDLTAALCLQFESNIYFQEALEMAT